MKLTGENIKSHCEKANLSPKELSRLFNIDISTIYYWFNGKTLPRFDIAYNIADLCNCTLDNLIVLQQEEEEDARD